MKMTGLTQRLMERLTTEPQSFKQMTDGFTQAERKSAYALLRQKANAGHIEITGQSRAYRYALPRKLKPTSIPENPASGRCIDALAAVMRSQMEPMTRADIIEAMPKGYAPHDVVSAMSDAVVAGWLVSTHVGGATAYRLSEDIEPGAHAADPLAVAYAAITPRQRVDQVQVDLRALLEQQMSERASPTVLHHIAAANHHMHQLHAFLD